MQSICHLVGKHYKHMFYTNESIDLKKYKRSLEEHNQKFQETIRIGNIYNRMIAYSASESHCCKWCNQKMKKG